MEKNLLVLLLSPMNSLTCATEENRYKDNMVHSTSPNKITPKLNSKASWNELSFSLTLSSQNQEIWVLLPLEKPESEMAVQF